MVLITIANAILCEGVLANSLNELHAHQVSTFTAVFFFGIYIWFVINRWEPVSQVQSLLIGFTWLGMTIAFEFLFGHYVIGNFWNMLLHDYNIFAGRLWVLIPFWVTIVPSIYYRLRHN